MRGTPQILHGSLKNEILWLVLQFLLHYFDNSVMTIKQLLMVFK